MFHMAEGSVLQQPTAHLSILQTERTDAAAVDGGWQYVAPNRSNVLQVMQHVLNCLHSTGTLVICYTRESYQSKTMYNTWSMEALTDILPNSCLRQAPAQF